MKWYWEKIEGKTSPPSPAAELGSRIHEELERFLKQEMGMSELSAIARAGIHNLPSPIDVDPDNVETVFTLAHRDMVAPIKGIIDLVVDAGSELRVIDHKTTSQLKYAKTPEELAVDVQAVIYAYYVLKSDEELRDSVVFEHVYYCTKNPKSQKTTVTFTEAELEERFAEIIAIVNNMKEASQSEIGAVPVNTSACGDYGGCPFRSDCISAGKLNPFAGIATKKKEKEPMSSAFQKMLEQRRQLASQKPAPEPTPEVVETTPEVEELKELSEGLIVSAEVNPPDGMPMEQATTLEGEPVEVEEEKPLFELEEPNESWPSVVNGQQLVKMKKSELLSLYEACLEKSEVRITPSKKTRPVLIEACKSMLQSMLKLSEEGFREAVVEANETAGSTMIPEPEPEPEDQEIEAPTSQADLMEVDSEKMIAIQAGMVQELVEKLNDVVKANVQLQQAAQKATQDAFEAREELKSQRNEAASEALPILAIGCLPSTSREQGDTHYLEEFLRPMQASVEKAQGVPFFGLIEYGQGPKMVAAQIAVMLHEGWIPPDVMICDRRLSCTDAVLEVLRPWYLSNGVVIERSS